MRSLTLSFALYMGWFNVSEFAISNFSKIVINLTYNRTLQDYL